MQLLKLLKEENDLDTQILKNRIEQYKHLVSISKMPLSQEYPMSDKLDVFDKLRDLEAVIFQQLGDRAKVENQARLFGFSIKNMDTDIKNEFIREKAKREFVEKYKSMSLRELIKSKIDRPKQKGE